MMSVDDRRQLAKFPSANALVGMFTSGEFRCGFRLSHALVTQEAPQFALNVSPEISKYLEDLKSEPVQDLPQLIKQLKNVKEPETVKAFAVGQMTARLYHSSYSLRMANEKAALFLYNRAVSEGLGSTILEMLTQLAPSGLGCLLETVFLHRHHPYPYRIFDYKGAQMSDTIDLSDMYRSMSGDVLKNVTLFSSDGTAQAAAKTAKTGAKTAKKNAKTAKTVDVSSKSALGQPPY